MTQDWRNHPSLKKHFSKEYPDDVQVLIHDGGFRFTDKPPELVWVRVTGVQANVFTGQVLNQPFGLKKVRQGSEIKFLAPKGSQHPILVTQKYLDERDNWVIEPCNKCGLSELFDAPSELANLTVSSTPEIAPQVNKVLAFTTHCPIDGGTMVVAHKDAGLSQEEPQESKKKWWQFWKP